MSKELLQDIIKDFSPEKFPRFFREKNRSFAPRTENLIQYDDAHFRNGIKLGEVQFAQDEKMLICAFDANQPLSERSGKKAQYEKGKKILKESQSDAGIFIFYNPQGNFRFSLIYANYLGKTRDWSAFRRFTYFVSPSETNKTFLKQIGEGDFSSLEKIKGAFSVEKVTKEFYAEIANWYFWAMDKAQFPKDFKYSADPQKDDELRNAINLIRLITRIIFIWFIRQKGIIPDALFDKNLQRSIVKDFCRDNKSANYYNAILQNLFFGTLNQKMNERRFAAEGDFPENRKEYDVKTLYRYADKFLIDKGEVLRLFKDIPFLNGGLFDCLDREKIYIDGFSRNASKQAKIPDYLFFQENEISVDLSSLGLGRNQKIKGLFEILNNYNFTIDENTPVDLEIALDPELLGKVFENLLASYNPETQTTARKQTGSFYTPREIVNYMVDESLIAYLSVKLTPSPQSPPVKGGEVFRIPSPLAGEGKGEGDNEFRLRHLLSYTEEPHKFSPAEVKTLIKAIDNLKALDPACGSGAFPMGILHKLVHILHKLDPKNEQWKKRQIEKAKLIDDPNIRQNAINDIEAAFESNELDYGRKLYLIENSIYGVDIQSIAVQIAKLRFFISLIIDEKKQPGRENLGIRSLPNLETKFVAANTLIGLDKPQGQQSFRNPEIERLEKELKQLRHEYFKAKTRKEKIQCQKQDKKLRQDIAGLLVKDGWNDTTAQQIVKFDPYDQNASADFFDPEWMFGIKNPAPLAGAGKGEGGFDIVIGNPPYGGEIDGVDSLAKKYKHLDRQKNSASFFIEVGNKLTNSKGVIAYIIPKSLSFSEGWKKTRELVTHKNRLLSVIDVCKAFEAVLLEQIIICFSKETAGSAYQFSVGEGWDGEIKVRGKGDNKLIDQLDILPMYIDNKKQGILNKLQQGSILLSEISKTFRGLPFQRKVSKSGQPILRGKNIGKYKIYGDIDNITLPKEILSSAKVKELLKPKILSQNIVAHVMNPYDRIIIMATIDNQGLLSLDTVMNTYLTADKFALQYVLAILNSQLASWFYYWFVYNRAVRTMHFDKYYIDKLPVKDIDLKAQQPFITLVDKILAAKKKDTSADTSLPVRDRTQTGALEHQIDQMVYELYGLTPEEISIVEGRN